MAEKYELGFTAYYDFNGAGKCENRIEYEKQFPNVFDAAIAGAVTLEILIQVALLILTEGATAELALAKLGKAGVKLPGKFAKMSSKAAVNIDEISKTRSIISKIDKAYTILKAPAFTYYKGYRFAEGEEIGIEPLLEEKLAFSPLLDLKHLHERSLGELVLKKTAVGIVINLTQKALSGLKIGFNRFILSKENRSTAKLVDHYVGLVEEGVNVVEDYLSFITDRIFEEVFGVGAKYSLEVSGQFGMDFELKIHNASHTLDLENFLRKESVKDASVATAAPSAGMNVLMKVEAKVKLPVRAMNILNYSDISNTKISKAEGDFKLKVQSGIFWERKFFYHASDKKPYYQDTVIFTGICGEYDFEDIVKGRDRDRQFNINNKQKSEKFILIPSQILNHSPIPYFKNPLDYI